MLLALMITPMFAAKTHPASNQPPGGLSVPDVPQFVMLGFDDNPDVEPMVWFTHFLESRRNPAGAGNSSTFDGAPVRAAFFSNGKYFPDSAALRAMHLAAFRAGHEIANHTQNHEHGREFTEAQWRDEMTKCTGTFAGAGIPAEAIRGFRAPFLEHNPAMFAAAESHGLAYDTSLEEGGQPGQDGRNFLWPYTLHDGSPGNANSAAGSGVPALASHPGLWEIPIHVFIVPADDQCEHYGIKPGLRGRIRESIKKTGGWDWDAGSGKITGLDWSVLEAGLAEPEEFLAILKHTLDLRLEGNRAPFMVGGHTALYPAANPGRRRALEAFIDYALSKPEVRFVTPMQLLAWMREPAAIASGAQ